MSPQVDSLSMHFLCKHKISIHSATPSHSYPVIRLPREFAALAGENAHIYQKEHDGKLEFVISVDKPLTKFVQILSEVTRKLV
jgi:hypothetical protein